MGLNSWKFLKVPGRAFSLESLKRALNIAVVAPAETPGLFLRLTTKCMTSSRSFSSPKFNREQCKYVAHKLEVAVQSAHSYFGQIKTWYSTFASPEDQASCLAIFRLLFALGKEVESFIQTCCNDEWVQSAIMFANALEHVSSIGFYLEFCIIVFSKKKNLYATPSMTRAEVRGVRQAEAVIVKRMGDIDEARLCDDLRALIQRSLSSSAKSQLASFLHERLRSARVHSCPDSAGSCQPTSHPEILISSVIQKQRLGTGASGIVHRGTWLGADVAQKTFHGPSNPDFVQEVSILERLNHPNIVSMFWYMMDKQKCQIIMELMDKDLNTLLEERLLRNSLFTVWEAVGIMLQVAEGVLFLHENNIVHRDLKSNNILVRLVEATEVDLYYMEVKVADFGLSKTKEKSKSYSSITPNIGTTRWMAPELMKIQNDEGQTVKEGEVVWTYPFKSDVYSFGMVCYEILTGHMPFSNLTSKDVRKEVLCGGRPELPDQCPIELRTLVEACWSSEASTRPDFVEICEN